MTSAALSATTCVLSKGSNSETPREIWEEIALALCDEKGERYTRIDVPYKLLLPETRRVSPSSTHLCFRTLNMRPRVREGCPVLLDIDVGNWFCSATDPNSRIHTESIPESKWVRNAASIPLQDHIGRAGIAFRALRALGWGIERAEFVQVPLRNPVVETADGIADYTPDKLSRIAASSIRKGDVPRIGILQIEDRRTITDDIQALRSAWHGISASRTPPEVCEVDDPLVGPRTVTLVLLPDNVDLAVRDDLRRRLKAWEECGSRFKLARTPSLRSKFAAQNICFDLAAIAGFIHWHSAKDATPATAFDAGHDQANRRSRWACADLDNRLRIDRLRTVDGVLAEHIPDEVADQFWPSRPDAMVLRDGRMARERIQFTSRSAREGRWLLEVKKHPGAVLFRKSDGVKATVGARYGDALIDPHGDVLLQTISQSDGDCIHPIRVSTSKSDRNEQLQALFAQTAVRTLSMFRPSRLPGAIYWADLASKLDKTGWTQVIGRGWRLSTLVPAP